MYVAVVRERSLGVERERDRLVGGAVADVRGRARRRVVEEDRMRHTGELERHRLARGDRDLSGSELERRRPAHRAWGHWIRVRRAAAIGGRVTAARAERDGGERCGQQHSYCTRIESHGVLRSLRCCPLAHSSRRHLYGWGHCVHAENSPDAAIAARAAVSVRRAVRVDQAPKRHDLTRISTAISRVEFAGYEPPSHRAKSCSS